MSTVTAPERSHAPYAEPDEYIDYQLRKTQTGIKRNDMFTAGAVAITVLIGYVLLFVLADHWLFEGGASPAVRWLMLLPVLGAIGWLVGTRIVLPALKNVSGLYAARTLEASSTEFRSSLLNLIDLKRAERPVAPIILATMEKRAAVTLTKLNVEDAIDKRPLLTTLYVLFGVVVAFCLYSVLSPKKLGPSVLRAIAPFANVTPATQTEILEVKPGDAKLHAGAVLHVEARLRGEIPAEVRLLYTTDDRRFVDQPFDLNPRVDEPTLFEGEFGLNETGLLQSLTYHIEAGDARSPEYRVEIMTPPSATVTEVRFDYPEYTELDPRVQPGGAIDVWELTNVAISAATNLPIKRAELELSDTEDFKSSYPGNPVKSDGKKLTAFWRADRRQADGKFPKFYRIKVWDNEGNTDPKPAIYPINVRIDQPPQVALLAPTADLEMPANGTVPLVVAARDPDFKLARINLKIAREDETSDETLFTGSQTEVSLRHDFHLEPMRLKAGDKLRIWVEAQDNRLPAHNLSKTPPIVITIKDKVSKEEARKQLDEQKRQQDQQLGQNDKKNFHFDEKEKIGQEAANQEDPRTVLKVWLFDDQNQPIDVEQYSRQELRLEMPLLRGTALGDYIDGEWSDGSPADREPFPVAAGQQPTIRQVVQQPMESAMLFALPLQVAGRVEHAHPQIVRNRASAVLYRDEKIPNREEIKYELSLARPTPAERRLPFTLALRENHLAAREREQYTRIPAHGMQELRDLANQLAKAPDGSKLAPMEMAQRMLDKLKTSGEFTYQAEDPATSVEEFLRNKRGVCRHFATALALMLRTQGIPTRYIRGFKGGERENGSHAYVVQARNAHAWIEAHIDGQWFILDPTPNQLADPNQEPRNGGEQQPGNEGAQNQNSPNGHPNNQSPNGQNKGAQANDPNGKPNGEPQPGQERNKQPLKNDGSQDQEALQKLIEHEKEKGRLPKPQPPQESSPSPSDRKQNGQSEPSGDPDPKSSDPKTSDPKTSDPKTSDPKSSDPKSSDPKSSDSKSSDPKSSDPKSNDPKSNDPKTSDPKSSDPKSSDPKSSDPKTSDPKSSDPKSSDPKSSDPKSSDPKSSDPKSSDPKSSDPKSSDPKSSDPKSSDPKSNDPKSNDPKSNDPKSNDPKSSDPKSSDPKSSDPKSSDPKSSDPKSSDPKSSDPKSSDPKSSDPKSSDPKSSDPKSSDPKSSDPKSSDPKSSDPKSSDPKSSDPKSSDPKSSDPKSSDPKSNDPKSNDPKSNDPKSSVPKLSDPKSSDPKSNDPKTSDPKSSDPKSSDPKSNDPKSNDPKSSDPKSSDPKSSDPKSNDPKSNDPKSNDPKSNDPKSNDPKSSDPKSSDPKSSDPKSSDPKSSDPKSSDPKTSDPKSSDPKTSDPKAAQSKPGKTRGKSEKPNGTPGEGDASQGGMPTTGSDGPNSDGTSEAPEDVNEEFAREAADLVLKRLAKEIERGDVDQELLDKLGWTPEQLKKFVDRLQQQLDGNRDVDSPAARAKQRQFEEMLRNLNLSSKSERRDDTNTNKQSGDGVGSVRRPPPPEYREAYEHYTKNLSKKQGSAPPKK